MLLLQTTITMAQAPNLGTVTDFVVFTTNGAVVNFGKSHLTGNVGTNLGSNIGFGNVNGNMHAADSESAQASTDLVAAYNELNATLANAFPASQLGNGASFIAGVFGINSAATLEGNFILDAQNNSNAVFIFKIDGQFSSSANAKVILRNGAQACNVFWQVEGLVELASGTSMKGTIIANNAAIYLNANDTIEGRMLSIGGAISLNDVMAYTPAGCGSTVLTGPIAPTFDELGCYGLFTADGHIENVGLSNIIGDVGSNTGTTNGFLTVLVSGNIHPNPDGSTEKAADDLVLVYNYLNGLQQDITLKYPSQFGGNLVLTPHTYLLDGATALTDSLYLNAQGNSNAVFVFKIEGALSANSYSKVFLSNGAKADNVYWLVKGAVELFEYAVFNGNIIAQGAVSLSTEVELNGKAHTTVGAITSEYIYANAEIVNCNTQVGGAMSTNEINAFDEIFVYPNPLGKLTAIYIAEIQHLNKVEIYIYNVLGAEVLHEITDTNTSTFDTSFLLPGIYFYKVKGDDQILKTGKLIAK